MTWCCLQADQEGGRRRSIAQSVAPALYSLVCLSVVTPRHRSLRVQRKLDLPQRNGDPPCPGAGTPEYEGSPRGQRAPNERMERTGSPPMRVVDRTFKRKTRHSKPCSSLAEFDGQADRYQTDRQGLGARSEQLVKYKLTFINQSDIKCSLGFTHKYL